LKTKNHIRAGDRLRISYHPKGQKAKRIPTKVVTTVDGHDLVVVDSEGKIYTTWWTDKAELYQYFHPVHRRWRCYDLGIFALQRSLLYALTDNEQIKIPTIGQLQTFCRIKNVEISLLEGNTLIQLEKIAGQFEQLWKFLKAKRNQPLVKSKIQLSFFLLLHDSLGRVNIGVLRVRLAAIDFNFMKELKHICGWMPHYAARLQAVRNFQIQLKQNITDAKSRLSAMVSAHEAMTKGITSEKQIKGISAVIKSVIETIGQLKEIQPFCHWAEHCLDDLKGSLESINANNLKGAKVQLKKAIESINLRIIAFDLEKLIEQIGLDLLLGRTDKNAYQQQLADICKALKKIDESGFSEPVCQKAIDLLSKGIEALNSLKVADAKKFLKEAAKLI